ncbi:BLUF domain-containing protein [Hymenobacter puniceus]|uniref:BLUF domain-containing protein n=1 Tax=Hymenobacter sp. BT190 TaxID=2763505 RepID=UPI00165162F1|nr:BLUF domain-containing protein [Hymenobacter sp. BT190]MBC6700153.1 BLUF domain-containing protein [Hymenobacter sp. BT190]
MPLFLDTVAQRRQAVAFAVTLTAGTPLAPQRYERQLLAQFEAGILDLDEIEQLLAQSVYQLLYHSHATHPPTETDLRALLAQAEHYNARHQLTGLLLYSAGRYVQVLEGTEADVQNLYARIRRDPRHEQVVTVSAGPAPRRHFADWSMGFGHVAGPDVDRVLDAVQAPQLPPGFRVDDAHLQALLDAFAGHPTPGAPAG